MKAAANSNKKRSKQVGFEPTTSSLAVLVSYGCRSLAHYAIDTKHSATELLFQRVNSILVVSRLEAILRGEIYDRFSPGKGRVMSRSESDG